MRQLKKIYLERELLWNLTLRELRGKYRRSFLGWAWSMINPLSTVLIFSFVFIKLFHAVPPVGNPSGLKSYALYLLVGLIPWNFFALISSIGLGSVLGNPTLVRKVAFSKEILVFAQVLFSLVQFSIEMTIVLTVVTILGGSVFLWIPFTICLMILLTIFGSGFALALSVLVVYFRDLNYLWGILLQLMFYATPIVYADTLVDERLTGPFRYTISHTPFALFIKAFRHMLYDGRAPDLSTWGFLIAYAAIFLMLGLFIFNKMSRRLPEEV